MVDVIVIYDTISGNTEKAAKEVYEGVLESGAEAMLKNVSEATENDLREAHGVILGSPCVNNNYSGRMREFLNGKLKNVRMYGKVGAAFGTYKWNGGNLHRLETEMLYHDIKIVAPGYNALKAPGRDAVKHLRELGKKVGEEVLKLKEEKTV
ncbi:FprA family A-type flavoprotein [Methanocella sp. CWC-04]|uniref:FprA family A-type flavoprotein n=1 Tax=Methanooceanicella nereidis TaxID=2052831 RepID=A0AAP2W4H2_9EURY|nr:flavodoxin domain-containing protein [Methanocella sp. CWC-04]MCD1294270.1 FprA family A-type flavoprotein [Methanocella sp. CWC-04]